MSRIDERNEEQLHDASSHQNASFPNHYNNRILKTRNISWGPTSSFRGLRNRFPYIASTLSVRVFVYEISWGQWANGYDTSSYPRAGVNLGVKGEYNI